MQRRETGREHKESAVKQTLLRVQWTLSAFAPVVIGIIHHGKRWF